MDLERPGLVRLIKQEATATDRTMRDVVVTALEDYFAEQLETKALQKAAESIFDEWNDPRDAVYDSL